MIRRSVHILVALLLTFTLLVSTHQGEFWPFSIYPMFSMAGEPWSRAIVHEYSPDSVDIQWDTLRSDEVVGRVFPMSQVGLNTNDLANLVAKNRDWSENRLGSIRHFFSGHLDNRSLVIYRVEGRIDEGARRNVRQIYTPYIYLTPTSTYLNPDLSSE